MASAMSASPQSAEERGSLPSPAPPQASPAAASPPQARSPHTVLATMTPVPAQDFDYTHKVEIDSNDGYPPDIVYSEKGAPLHPDVYHSDNKGAIIYQHSPNDIINYTQDSEKVVPSAMQGDMYGQDMGPIDEKTPIDLIYEDGKQTVIYTTTPDQKRVEMISGQMNDGQLITSGSQLVEAGVSVVVQGPSGQGTVLVLADHMVDELGQVISIPRRRKEVLEPGGEGWRGYYGSGELLDEPPLSDYCRLPPLAAHDATLPKDLKISDVWTSSGALKQTNGAPGAELGDLQGLFHSGLVKREPEDLSRKVPDEQAESQSALKPPRHKVPELGEAGSPAPSRASSAGSLLPEYAAAHLFAPAASPGGAPYPPEQYAPPAQYAPYYREYFAGAAEAPAYQQRAAPAYEPETAPYAERYARAPYPGKGVLTVDLPSPDSGIGADAATPRDHTALHQSFDYTVICQQPAALEGGAEGGRHTPAHHSPGAAPRSRPWHDFGRQNDADKIQIPKLYSPYGFKYHLESPISSSQRREDDRITYINKGQFYGITLEYIHDPDKPIKNQTVKSVVMLMFREEKLPEDEIKAWQFWHGRQHSVKQRILDADTKNSVGLAGCIEEVAHNAIAVYWNPLETLAKINVAVQCLSTDFSSQKGVKGLPLHIQIDTYEDPRDQTVFHRGYCQIKVFCDKGAERKTRDEERRAAKRKMTATGRKKLDELYHPVVERSEFYSMADLSKPPVLFSPAEDIDKIAGMDIQGFYGHDDSSLTGDSHLKGASPFLLHTAKPATPTLKFHNHFPPDTPSYRTEAVSPGYGAGGECESKRARVSPPPLSERVMLYVRQDADNVFTPLHVAPPTTQGLLHAIENKYKISSSAINNLYRKNKKGITAKIDDDMLAYYCNEDLFLLEVRSVDEDVYDITFVELPLEH